MFDFEFKGKKLFVMGIDPSESKSVYRVIARENDDTELKSIYVFHSLINPIVDRDSVGDMQLVQVY